MGLHASSYATLTHLLNLCNKFAAKIAKKRRWSFQICFLTHDAPCKLDDNEKYDWNNKEKQYRYIGK